MVPVTISTGQFYTMGAVGLILLAAIVAVSIRLASSFLLRGIVLTVALAFLVGCWTQKDSITQSLSNCDPHFLFIHIKIDDPKTMQACQELTKPGAAGPLPAAVVGPPVPG